MNKLASLLLIFISTWAFAQENVEYQKPSKPILDLVDVSLAPAVRINDDKSHMVMMFRDTYKSIDDLSKKEMRLAGLRIDPKTNISSRVTYYNDMKVKDLASGDGKIKEVTGLPENPRLAYFSWSPDETKMAFTHTGQDGVELYVLDVEKGSARKLGNMILNANMRDVLNWTPDSKAILVKTLPADRTDLIDAANVVPTGPTISVNDGKKAQNRTYQDLLKNKNDEQNFEQLARSELHLVGLDGKVTKWKDSDLYSNISFSPDGKYVMVTTISKPFSYLVPYYRFPSKSVVYDTKGNQVSVVNDVPLIEDLPKGFMAVRTGRRSLSWRADEPSTLVYVEALDGGDPENEVEYRDQVFTLEAPFKGEGKSLVKTKNRYSGIIWGDKENAIMYDYWWNNRKLVVYHFNPSKSSASPRVVFDRNYQDRYSDPGGFETKPNEFGRDVLLMKNGNAFLLGDGYTASGQYPFLSRLNLKSLKLDTLYKSRYDDKLENLYSYDPDEKELLVRIEAPTEYPNYYFRNISKNNLSQITDFENPFKSLENIHKEVITYKRDDGLELSGTLYLPDGYDKKEKLPMLLWAYPREFKDKSSASQNTQNPNEFTYLYYGSPIYWVAKGYAVLDDAAFPIVGEGDTEPNDSFRNQLVANGKAAIDAVDEMGYIDRERVGVGGHSYGAFMVANLLSHSDLFAAGIARSGAYNRTLTPFGFQSEERSYWEAPEVYYTMSPFMHADKMKTPLLLIHGEADNNSGTYPMQSERYFNALKGLGATVRLVMLPKESHGYRAKESILHMLYEQEEWLDKYVKNKGKEGSSRPEDTQINVEGRD